LCLTLVNSDPHQPAAVDLDVWGGRIRDASAITLVTGDIHDHNTFEAPDKVTVGESYDVSVSAGHVLLDLPAASVTRIFATLG
jgi:alpha-N-arabinofuranosidase